MAKDGSLDSEGPSSPPPPLPDGWLAQWEGIERKWYFVQRATGKAQWEIPTEPVILTPSTTPTSSGTGPSRAPSSRPQTNSPRTGVGSRGLGAEGIYAGGDRAGYSSFFGSQGSPHQGGLSQMAMGMLGRVSNYAHQDKPGGQQTQHGLLGYLSQHQNPQQNPFGYTSTGQSGTYAGTPPQYQASGQMQPGSGVILPAQTNNANQLMGNQQPPGLGFSQQFGVDTQGSLSSQFTQVPSQTNNQPTTNVTSPEVSSSSHAGVVTPQASTSQTGSPFPMTNQPSWQQSPVPQATKPQSSQPGTGPSNLAMGGHYSPHGLHGYSQQQQNLPQSLLGSQPMSQDPSQSSPGAELPLSQYPTTQAMDKFGQPVIPPPGLGQPFGSQPVNSFEHSASPSQGIQDRPPGFHSPQSVQPPSQYGPAMFGQLGQVPGQNVYGHTSQYQPIQTGPHHPGESFNQDRPNFAGSSVSPSHFNTQAATPGSFVMPNAPGTMQMDQFNQQFDPRQYPRPPSDQMGRFSGASIPPGLAGNFQAQFQQYPNQAYNTPSQWPGGNPGQPRPAMSDPQFVSGPWTSSSGPAPGYQQPPHYGGYGHGR